MIEAQLRYLYATGGDLGSNPESLSNPIEDSHPHRFHVKEKLE